MLKLYAQDEVKQMILKDISTQGLGRELYERNKIMLRQVHGMNRKKITDDDGRNI